MGIIKPANESDDDDEDGEFCFSDEETQLLDKDVWHPKESSKEKRKYPRAIFFILGNEFCERFSFYGMKTILTIYLTDILLYTDDTSTLIFHLFSMLAYFTPIFGAIIADTFLGKFKTIFYVSIVYAIGNIIVSGGAITQAVNIMRLISIIGLLIVAVGTGGIKPCVSAFGGDQFHSDQNAERERFFFVFYFMINCGSVLSTILTPILRHDVKCFGQDSCFPLAFGVPALLMIVALVIFLAGKSLYIIEEPKGNILTSVFGCIFHALRNRANSSEKKKDHWLDYAEDKYNKTLIEDIKVVLHILVLYIPLPVFWALFDQTGSRWTLQATKMDGEALGMHIKPDQMQVVNPFLILIFIPLFNTVFYPLLEKCNLLKKPLQRITVGGLLAALAFVMAGFIELKIESNAISYPAQGFSELRVVNLSPCSINMTGPQSKLINAFEEQTIKDLEINKNVSWSFTTVASGAECEIHPTSLTETLETRKIFESILLVQNQGELITKKVAEEKEKTESGESKVRLFYAMDEKSQNVSFKFQGSNTYYISLDNETSQLTYGITRYHNLIPGKYKIYLHGNDSSGEKPLHEVQFKSGGIYTASIYTQKTNENVKITTIVQPNTVSILYQIPQYVVLTAAEIMFSITGLEFSYSQAPLSMKSVMQAAWLLTVAFGNLIVSVVAEASLFEKLSWELFFFAILMAIDILIFAVLAYFYKYVKPKTYSEQKREAVENESSGGKVNDSYVEETDFNK